MIEYGTRIHFISAGVQFRWSIMATDRTRNQPDPRATPPAGKEISPAVRKRLQRLF